MRRESKLPVIEKDVSIGSDREEQAERVCLLTPGD